MYLIWRMDTTAKGAKKNTSPNVIHSQYFCFIRLSAIGFIPYLNILIINCYSRGKLIRNSNVSTPNSPLLPKKPQNKKKDKKISIMLTQLVNMRSN